MEENEVKEKKNGVVNGREEDKKKDEKGRSGREGGWGGWEILVDKMYLYN